LEESEPAAAAVAAQARGLAESERGVLMRRALGREGSRGDRDGGEERAGTAAAEAAAMVWSEQPSLQEVGARGTRR
jgi:hypothetical protein